MNSITRELVAVILVFFMSMGISVAQPVARDTAQESLQRSMERLERSMKEFDELMKGGSTPAVAVKRGDKKDGGIVYWTETDGKHGLIVYEKDLGILKWDEAEAACKKLGAGWRIPTKDELEKLYKANLELDLLGSFFLYHSSTEPEKGYVWRQSLNDGSWKKGYKSSTGAACAVRSF